MSISLRIRELKGDMSIPAFAELIEEEKPQRLQDVLSGRQKCPEDMLVRIVQKTGCDANWLLLGIGTRPSMSPRQRALLDHYEALSDEGKRNIEGTVSLLAKQTGKKKSA